MTLALSAVVLPDVVEPAEFLATASRIEDAGLRGVWTYDHLSWRHLRDGPWHAAVPLLAAVAVRTTTVRLGTLVTSPNFRHPVPLAKDVMTIDRLSGGRVDLGIGAGGTGSDATALGQPAWSPADRSARFAEWADLLDALLRQGTTTSAGVHYSADDARMLPGCTQSPRVPLVIAAAGPRALAVAARHADSWVTFGPVGAPVEGDAWWAAVTAQSAGLDAVAAQIALAAGDPVRRVRRMALLGLEAGWAFIDYPAFVDRAAAAGLDEVVVHWPRTDGTGLPADALAEVLRVHGLA